MQADKEKGGGIGELLFPYVQVYLYKQFVLKRGTDVQELLKHAEVKTTRNIYAHATREAKRTSARLPDKVIVRE